MRALPAMIHQARCPARSIGMRTVRIAAGVLAAAVSLGTSPLAAEGLVAARTIRPQTVLRAEDVRLAPGPIDGAVTDPAAAIGLEARVTIFEGRPVRLADLSAPALVERNAVVTILYRRGALEIRSSGRALGRAAAGDSLRVLNTQSRTVIVGTLRPDGTVEVIRSEE